MKKLLSLALLLSVISFSTFGQEMLKIGNEILKDYSKKEREHRSSENIAESRISLLNKQVQLTEKQRKQVNALNLKEVNVKEKLATWRQKNVQSCKNDRVTSKEQLNRILDPAQ